MSVADAPGSASPRTLLLHLKGGREAYYSEEARLREYPEGLVIEVSDGGGTASIALFDEAARGLEDELYRYRIRKAFTNRKESDADGSTLAGAELQGRAPAPPHP